MDVNGLFEKHFKEIYAEELELKKESISNTKDSFVDINLEIKENKILTKRYDKRDYLAGIFIYISSCNSNLAQLSPIISFHIKKKYLFPAFYLIALLFSIVS